jgi:hypothetical protein
VRLYLRAKNHRTEVDVIRPPDQSSG